MQYSEEMFQNKLARGGRGLGAGGGGGGSSVLQQTADAMSAGSWTTLTCNYASDLTTLMDAGGGKRISEYADKMAWDAGRKQIYFTGGGHGQDEKTIVYDDASNSWNSLGTPPWYTPSPGNATHGYQHNTYANDKHYYGVFGGRDIEIRDVTLGNSWSLLGNQPNQFSSLTGAVEWFPSYGAGDSLMIVQGLGTDNAAGTVVRWFGGSWSEIGNPLLGGYHNIGVYSPILDLMYLGGGNGCAKIHTLSNAGTITAKADCAEVFGIITAVSTYDPVSGKFIAICGASQTVRVFDPAGNSWATDTAPPAGFWTPDGIYSPTSGAFAVLACAIPVYGVSMFITLNGPSVYLRKGRA